MATNFAALIYFTSTAHVLFQYAITMAIFNVIGSFFGAKLALLVIFGTILRFAFDVV